MQAPATASFRNRVAAGFAVVAGLQLWPLAWLSAERLAAYAFYRDDALFYATLARRFHELGFLSFDGEMATNGVQPLWMGLLLAVTSVLPGADPAALLARMSWVGYVLFAFLVTRLVCRGAPLQAVASAGVFGAAVLLNPAFQYFVLRGLEVPLLLALLAGLLTAVARADEILAEPGVGRLPARSVVVLGILSSLCFLARTDLFWLSVATGGWLLAVQRRAPSRGLLFGCVTAAMALPFLAFNALAFGSPVPISGRVKLYYLGAVYPTLADYLASEEWEGLFHAFASLLSTRPRLPMGVAVPAVLVLLAGALAVVLRDARRRAAGRRAVTGPLAVPLAVLGGAVLLHVLFMYAFYRELRPYTAYYFAPEIVFVGLVLARVLPRRAPARWVAVSGAVWLAATAVRVATLEPSDYWRSHLAAVEDVRALPADATVGAFWPGAFGAFSDRRVIPLDGIVGSPAYFASAVRRGLEIDHLLAQPKPHLAIYLHRTPEALLASDAPPAVEKWNQLGELRLWQYRGCSPRLVAGHPIEPDGTGWYLFRFDPEQVLACRRQVRAERPDLLVVVIDTLRPDRLDLYGYERETAPFLTRLGRDSAVFDHAFSSSSWTAPSTASLFSGLYPAAHGVRMGIHAHKALMKEVAARGEATLPVDRLPADVALLPELLRARGYATFGISTNLNVGKEMGFTRGFDRFHRDNMGSAASVRERLLDWKREILTSRPFFLYLHLNDVHAPYEPRAPWYAPVGDERGDTRAAYDSEIRSVDEVLAALAHDLDPDGDVVWVVLADHGEELWERGELGHLFSLHAEVNRIPLLIHAPLRGVAPRRVARNVSLVDLLPTLLSLAGPGPVPGEVDGRSLLPLLVAPAEADGVAPAPDRPLFAHRLHRLGTGQQLWAVVRGPWKLIEGPQGRRLFDLSTDPGELHDRSAQEPERVAALGELLEAHRRAARSSRSAASLAIDAQRLEELRRLGYVEEPRATTQ